MPRAGLFAKKAPLRRVRICPRNLQSALERRNLQLRKGTFVEPLIEREQAVAMDGCVRTDQEIGKNPAGQFSFLCAAPAYIALEGPARRSPDLFARLPLYANARRTKKLIEHFFRASGKCQQLRINGPGDRETTPRLSGIKSPLHGGIQLRVCVP